MLKSEIQQILSEFGPENIALQTLPEKFAIRFRIYIDELGIRFVE